MDNPFEILIKEFRDLKSIVLSGESSRSELGSNYLKIDKAAEFLSTTQNALRVMTHKGQINYIKKQGKLFFRRSDLIEWFESGSILNNVTDIENVLLVKTKKRL